MEHQFTVQPFTPFFDDFTPSKLEGTITTSEGGEVSLYSRTNELYANLVYTKLKTLPHLGRVLMTLSGTQAWDQFVNRISKVDVFLHIDANPEQKVFFEIIISSIVSCEDRHAAKKDILKKFLARFGDNKPYRQLVQYFKAEEHFLSTTAKFKKIRQAARDGRILSLAVNLANVEKVDAFFKAFTDSGLTLDTIYLSNLSARKWLGLRKFGCLLDKALLLNPKRKYHLIYSHHADCLCTSRLVQNVEVFDPKSCLPSTVKCPKDLEHQVRCIELLAKQILKTHLVILNCDEETPRESRKRRERIDELLHDVRQHSPHYWRDALALLELIAQEEALGKAKIDEYIQRMFPHQSALLDDLADRKPLDPIQFVIRNTKSVAATRLTIESPDHI